MPDFYLRRHMKRILIVALTLSLAVLFAGCSLFGGSNVTNEPLPIVSGTTTGNILNYGFCAKSGDELFFLYTTGKTYDIGSTIRSNPETGENSLLMEDGGLYMNIVDGWIYYCKSDGVFKAEIENPEPQLVLEADVKQLQISKGIMYFIEDGTLKTSTLDGEETDFSPVENTDCLNVYGDRLYYKSTEDNYIYSCDLTGADVKTELAHEVSMFIIMDDMIYYLDNVTGYLVKMELNGKLAMAIVEKALSGFNINRSNMYYTRYINGAGTCCNADVNGGTEQKLTDFGNSEWHIVCMYDNGALLAKIEDIE